MDFPTLLRIHESEDPPSALRALASSLAEHLPLRGAVWVGTDGADTECAWPDGAEFSPELLQGISHSTAAEIYPLGSAFPADTRRYGHTEALVLPLHAVRPPCGTMILVADAGAWGEDPQPWVPLGAAFARTAGRFRRLREAERECEQLRTRVEEAEALHTLGLAVNRTLDPDEVLQLVARLTRTLLGAHYVTVSTLAEGIVRTVASVGLRAPDAADGDYLLARTVVEAKKPLVVGGEGSSFAVGHFPFHGAERMQAGLGIPLSLFGDTFGALIAGYRRPYTVEPRDIRLALTLGGHAAVAISNARLHRALADRSAELERTYEELHRTSQMKERLFASLSHELRTPLNGILGYQNLLLEGIAGEIPPPARRYLEKGNRAAHNLLELVNDILDYAKLEAGKVELRMAPVTLREVVEDAVANVEPLAAQKGLALTVEPIEYSEPVHTDPNRVRQILVNLLSNAIKFTPAGEVCVEAARVDPPNDGEQGWVEMRVRDCGPGIAPEDREGIFREFEQVRGTIGGTGLGLPISRKLAQLLGGDLWVESEVGAGSTFVLRLPYAAEEPVPTGTAMSHVSSGGDDGKEFVAAREESGPAVSADGRVV